ncbi:hypothetical protein Rs2_17684 [Raphanus sativus]|nr:hypothetical protein Rs2_17684 [Raphanus sativus]
MARLWKVGAVKFRVRRDGVLSPRGGGSDSFVAVGFCARDVEASSDPSSSVFVAGGLGFLQSSAVGFSWSGFRWTLREGVVGPSVIFSVLGSWVIETTGWFIWMKLSSDEKMLSGERW